MLTPLQRKTIQAIVNIFETSRVTGNYANVTLLSGDSGGLTYGRSQTTLMSGNLYLLVRDYCNAPGANKTYVAVLSPFLPRLQARDWTLNGNMILRGALYAAGGLDPVMKSVQDAFFDRVYFSPALVSADRLGITTPLGIAVIYDSTVHGSLAMMALRTTKLIGGVVKVGEKEWIARYVPVRRAWLASKSGILAETVYRQDTFEALINRGNWNLDLPVTAHDIQITAGVLGAVAEPVTVPYKLLLNSKPLGETWTNPKDGRNYFAVRPLLAAIFGAEETNERLNVTTVTGVPTARWYGEAIPAPVVIRDSTAWIELKGFADWKRLGLMLSRDTKARTVILARK